MTKILLADDSVTIQKVVELTFSDQESEVTTVGDGAAALEKAQLERPDIILSDVIMPGMNGYELCQSVKSDPNLKGIPFLFLKGTFESFDEDKARECGADGFIVKPFESQELISKVKELVSTVGGTAPAAAEAPVPLQEDIPAAPPVQEAAPAPPVAQAPPVPASPEVPVVAPPSPPQVPPPAPVPPAFEPAASPEVPTPVEESFDLGEEDLVAEEAFSGKPEETFPDNGAEKEPDEDLWSEVSLRETTAPLIEDKVLEDESFWGAAGELDNPPADEIEPSGEDLLEEIQEPEIFDLGEEAVASPAEEPAGETTGEDRDEAVPADADALFDAPVVDSVEPMEPLAAEELSLGEIEETPPSPTPPPVDVEPPAPDAPIQVPDLERAVSAKIEEAIRSILGPAIEESAKKIVEEVAWEVIPDLAEAMIKSEIERIKSEKS